MNGTLLTLLALTTVAAALSGCAEADRALTTASNQADATLNDVQAHEARLERDASTRIAAIDLGDMRAAALGAIHDAWAAQPVRTLRCTTPALDGPSITAVCTSRLAGGTRVRVPLRYTPGVGLVPGLPTITHR